MTLLKDLSSRFSNGKGHHTHTPHTILQSTHLYTKTVRGRYQSTKIMKQFVLLLAIALIASVAAECPNACSGHGNCEAFDQCNCQRGWQAADCSERQCPMGYAFTTTPQGDLNMDGDREDNSYKQLSEPGVIAINTNTITFARSDGS